MTAAAELLVWQGGLHLPGEPGLVRGGGQVPLWLPAAICVLSYSVLALSRARPLLVYAVLWAFGGIGVLLPHFQPFLGLLVALYTVARLCPVILSLAALAATAAPIMLNVMNQAAALGSASWAEIGGAAAVWAVIAVVCWGLGLVARSAASRHAVREAELTEELRRARAEERRRLAADLHDSVAGSLSGMVMQAAGVRALNDPAAVGPALEVIETSGVQALREMRRLLVLLQDGETTPREQQTLDGLLQSLPRARALGVRVVVHVDGEPAPLDPSVDEAAVRVIEESTNNCAKHGGPGASLEVRVEWAADSVCLTTLSRREGPRKTFPLPPTGHGLAALRERVEIVGGAFTVEPGEVFVIRAVLPVFSKELR